MTTATADPVAQFEQERTDRIQSYPQDQDFLEASRQWTLQAFDKKYMYNFDALGRPIIQLPADIVAMSELIWTIRPDVIVETGIAHGGSIVHSAAQLALLDMCDAIESGELLDPSKPKRRVIAVDIDIREHNRSAIESHPMANRIKMFQGSSLDQAIIDQVYKEVGDAKTVLVTLDSNHTHDHVLDELRAYAPLTSVNSYCVVFDTIVEDLPAGFFEGRPWDPGNSPRTAIAAYLAECADKGLKDGQGRTLEFKVDMAASDKLAVTAAPGGFLVRVG